MKIFGILTRSITALILGASFAGALERPAAAACGDVPESRLKVYVAQQSALDVIATAPADMVRAAAGADEGVAEDWKIHPLVLFEPRFASQLSIDEHAIQGEGHTYCAAPAAIQVRIGVSDYRVRIDRRAYADDCVRNVMIEHAKAHLADDNQAMTAFIAEARDLIAGRISKLKRTAFDDEQAAVNGFKAGMGDVVVELLNGFNRERPRLFGEINRPWSHADLSAACNGRVGTLEAEARFRGERADAGGASAFADATSRPRGGRASPHAHRP
jgi:hypothetical protein